MAGIWSLQAHALSPKEEKIRQFANIATGKKFPTLSRKIASMFSLYDFFNAHQNVDPSALQPYITDEGQPMFSVNDIKEIQATIKKQTSQPMSNANARRIVEHIKMNYAPALELVNTPTKGGRRTPRRNRHGGAAPPTVGVGTPVPPAISLRDPTDPKYNAKDDMLGAPERPGFVDKSRDGFFDRIFLKMGNLYSNSPFALKFSHKWDGIFWFMFLLYNLENVDFFGPFLSAGLDAYIVAVRMAVDALHENMPKLLSMVGGILPIGVGGIGGTVLGEGLSAAIGGLLLMGTIIVSISRKHFGDAFKNGLEMIPVFGDYLMTFAMSAETNLDRINIYRNKMVHMINNVSPTLYNFVDYWVPKLEPLPPTPPPIPSLADIKNDIVNKGLEKTGADKYLAKAQEIAANPLGAAAAATGANAMLAKAQNVAANPLGAAAAATGANAMLAKAQNVAANPLGAAAAATGANTALAKAQNIAANPAAAAVAPALPPMPTLPNLPAAPTASSLLESTGMNKTVFPPTPIRKRGGTRRKPYKRKNRRHTKRRR
jgi:hypothetical protein